MCRNIPETVDPTIGTEEVQLHYFLDQLITTVSKGLAAFSAMN